MGLELEKTLMALPYGSDSSSSYLSKEAIYRKRPDQLFGGQNLGLMQLLLEYGVAPASTAQSLVQKLTVMMQALALAR